MVYNWGHLHTIMACNTVEFALVALAVSEQRFLSPMADFYPAMFTHNVVSLLLQLRLQERVHRISDKYCRFNPTLDVQVVRSPFMEESEEGWSPHLLGFILPLRLKLTLRD